MMRHFHFQILIGLNKEWIRGEISRRKIICKLVEKTVCEQKDEKRKEEEKENKKLKDKE